MKKLLLALLLMSSFFCDLNSSNSREIGTQSLLLLMEHMLDRNEDNDRECNAATPDRELCKIAFFIMASGLAYGWFHDLEIDRMICPEFFDDFPRRDGSGLCGAFNSCIVTMGHILSSMWWLSSLTSGMAVALASRGGTWKKLIWKDLSPYVIPLMQLTLAIDLFISSVASTDVLCFFAEPMSVAEIAKRDNFLNARRAAMFEEAHRYARGGSNEDEIRRLYERVDQRLDREFAVFAKRKSENFFRASASYSVAYIAQAFCTIAVVVLILKERYVRTCHSLKKELEAPVVVAS